MARRQSDVFELASTPASVRRSCKNDCLRFTRRIFCCICPSTTGESSQYQMKNQLRCFTLNSPEDDEVRMQIQEDGTAGFIESENPERRGVENPSSTERWSIGRSVSSVSTTQRAKQRKKLTPLSSLPLQTCMKRGCKTSICSDEETEDLFGSSAGGLLTPPVINLIPPTPSDVIDDDQFFDINSEEECGTHTSGSECVDSSGSHATGDQESFMGGQDNIEALCGYQESELPLDPPREDSTARDLNENTWFQLVFERNKPLLKDGDRTRDGFARTPSSVVEADKSSSMRSIFQVAPLPRYPRKRSFNTVINLIQFTEQNLDDLNNKDMNPCERLKAELRLLPLITKMDPLLHSRKPVTRTCSLGDVSSARRTFQTPLRHSGKEGSEEEGSPPQRRITVASYIPPSEEQNGDFTEKKEESPAVSQAAVAKKVGVSTSQSDSTGVKAKTLEELNTEEVCQWFSRIGLQKCIPFIKGANLQGPQIATIDLDTLDLLQLTSVEERENFLSAVYRELHPQDTTTQILDTLLETIGPHDVEKFTAALVNLSNANSQQHSDCVNTPCQFQHRVDKRQNNNTPKTPHLVELAIKDDFEEVDKHTGELIIAETGHLELHLDKKAIPTPEAQHDLRRKDKINELNRHIDSLKDVIHQVQDLQQSLILFNLEHMASDFSTELTCLTDIEHDLNQNESKLQEKERLVQSWQHRCSKQESPAEEHLLDKMKLDCQIFMEEISLLYLKRQKAYLRSMHQMYKAKESYTKQSLALTQLITPQSPGLLLVALETSGPGGYGFTVQWKEGHGLLVVEAVNSQLCINDRLLEVNGVSVVDCGEEELKPLLSCQSSRIVVLRKYKPFISQPSYLDSGTQHPAFLNLKRPA